MVIYGLIETVLWQHDNQVYAVIISLSSHPAYQGWCVRATAEYGICGIMLVPGICYGRGMLAMRMCCGMHEVMTNSAADLLTVRGQTWDYEDEQSSKAMDVYATGTRM